MDPRPGVTLSAARTHFLEGPPGSGKTGVLLAYLHRQRDAARSDRPLLVVVATPTRGRLLQRRLVDGPEDAVVVETFFETARRSIRTAWPRLAPEMGFGATDVPPAFLTYETAQYTLARLLDSRLGAGLFEDLHLSRPEVYNQLLDSLTIAAAHGLPFDEIFARLSRAWEGPPERLRSLDQARACLAEYRAYCLARNLLDAALTLEAFGTLLAHPSLHTVALPIDQTVGVDHVEELPALAHDWIEASLPVCKGAVLSYETNGGFRTVLGVDPDRALRLSDRCDARLTLEAPPTPAALDAFSRTLAAALVEHPAEPFAPSEAARIVEAASDSDLPARVTEEVRRLLDRGTKPGAIAVTAPFLDGVLRYTLSRALEDAGIPQVLLRRSERLWDNPVVHAVFTAYALAHPAALEPPPPHAVAELLRHASPLLDPVRARLLADTLYDEGRLLPAAAFPEADRPRISGPLLEAYDRFVAWIDSDSGREEQDLEALIRDLLVGSPFVDRASDETVRVLHKLQHSVAAFMTLADRLGIEPPHRTFAYRRMLERRVGASLDPESYEASAGRSEHAVTLAPVLTLLLSGRRYDYQIWLDVDATMWGEPVQRALTNPVVLSPAWPPGNPWQALDERRHRRATLARRTTALLSRCRRGVILTRTARSAGDLHDGLLGETLLSLTTTDAPRT